MKKNTTKPKRTLGEEKASGSRNLEVGGREFTETVSTKMGSDGVEELHVDYQYIKPKYKATSRFNPKTRKWEKL